MSNPFADPGVVHEMDQIEAHLLDHCGELLATVEMLPDDGGELDLLRLAGLYSLHKLMEIKRRRRLDDSI